MQIVKRIIQLIGIIIGIIVFFLRWILPPTFISWRDQGLKSLRRCEQQIEKRRFQKVQVEAVFEHAPDPGGFAGSPGTEKKEALLLWRSDRSGIHNAIFHGNLELSTQKNTLPLVPKLLPPLAPVVPRKNDVDSLSSLPYDGTMI